MVSEKANKIGESPTLKVTAKAKAMKAGGIDIIDLSVGEPDFPTPDNVKRAGVKAIEENFTKYTQNEGIPDLKDAIIKRLKEDHALEYKRNEIIVSTGAKSSLYHLIQALINDGDEVIIPAPYWVTYPHAVSLANGKSVTVPTKEENGFLLTPDELKSAITPATKALVLNNPSNPTGAAYPKHALEALADVVMEEDIFVIADEVYEKLVYDDFRFYSFASLGEEIKKKTIMINGVSKAYSMTGWRIGFAAGPADIINGMAKIQSHSTSNPCSISQKASLEAYRGPQYEVSKMVSEFQRRRNYVLMRLQSLPEVSCHKPQGAFYLFPNFSSTYKKEFNNMPIRNSYGLAYFLLKEAKVAIVPGDAFGADDHIRLSYATSMENLEKALDRIIEAVSRLKTAKKIKRIALNNTVTHVKKSVPVDSSISASMRDALVAEMEDSLSYDNYFEWNANINGVIVQLRTNVSHLNDFWIENWYPAQLEADLEPHGIIYAVDGIPGREPRAFYNSETKTGILVNTDTYAPLRSLAFGLVIDVSERLFSTHSLRGMSVDVNGQGLVLIGPKGTKKSELFYGLLQDKDFRLHSNDILFVRFSGEQAVADSIERKLVLPTNVVEFFPRLAPLFDNSKCENVITRKENCQDTDCLRIDDCRLDRGSPFCYKASKNAVSLLDPYWIEGPAKHAKRTSLRWIFILRYDTSSPSAVEMETEDALRILESGESLGLKTTISPPKSHPFFNPHLLMTTPERIEYQKNFFQKLLQHTTCYLFNSGVASADDIKHMVRGEV
ncbi:MAG: pyridoxal phosphate-dependent aminotransferase [Candidatus Aminicenantes bacterium]|nr:pyridoxal phosphate-dependent aminotransferase [Candidatus Aminicenantes bacterium]MDH5383150.1 pyridoxal phosphate-dependent aminotransferase [Candidatus Aminicenantes bacterium]MDH5742188.1 pyridoxal phosphate-dependent aminotransferase [Candidatus Aminicenantes bacterium]